ncbi:Acyl-coenzyme A thioesterase 12 [Tulasnella sp. 427]|nr:Acyl-coenzyme A thioesterase 12 [Tulasnella sp. 427]
MIEIQEVLHERKRERRNTWTEPGNAMDSDLARSTTSWMLEPGSPSKRMGGRRIDIPASISEHSMLFDEVPGSPLRFVPIEETYASTLHIVMPQHANSSGVLFGGQLMEWMEKTALLAAQRLKREDCSWTTAGMDGLEFREAVAIGDVLTFRAVVTKTWRSSIEVYVSSHADIPGSETPSSSSRFTNECFISLVALSQITAASLPLNTEVVLPHESPAEKVSVAADLRKAERLHMKDLLVTLYAKTDPLRATVDGRPTQQLPLNVPFPAHMTKYPVTFDMFTQKYTPASLTAKFFEADLGYKDDPRRVYQDLLDAFKFNRAETLQGTGIKDEWSSEQAMKQFKAFMEKGKKRDLIPDWWTPEHEIELYATAKDDADLRADRPYDWEARQKRVQSNSRENDEMRLGMIAEKVFFDENNVMDPKDYSGPQYEAIGMY